ncbi:MAG: Gfo/Idh/MocA family oxidoreductase [Sporichthyaceae bacterium]
MTVEEMRVALVGYGMAGREIHAPLLRGTAGLRVTHVVTGNAERAEAARADLPGVTVLSSADDVWAVADQIDLAVLASPNAVHYEQAVAAIESGTAVVVDKPLATDADQARQVVDLAAERAVPLTVFQNRRWDSDHLTARRVLAEGVVGDVIRLEARYERWRPVPKQRWREQLSTDEGGGLLLDLQSHLVDASINLLGPVATVYAELAALSTVGDDVTFLALEHRSGARSHLGATALAGAPGPRLRLLGREAAYVVAAVDGESTAYQDWLDLGADQRGWLLRGGEREPVAREPGGWSAFYPAVVAMVRDGAPPPVDPRDAVVVLEVLDAARRSARERSVVRLGGVGQSG